MGQVVKMKVANLLAMVTHMPPEFVLRPADPDKIAEYAEKMEQGVIFPPPIIGKFPQNEKYGSESIADGVHRISAAALRELDSMDVEVLSYKSLQDFLVDMYVRNNAHGLPITEAARNVRITLLRKMGMTLQQIAPIFKLGKSSIARIEKGLQGEGKPGRKAGGATASKAHNSQKPKTATQLFKTLEKVHDEFKKGKTALVSDLVSYLTPAKKGKDTEGVLDKARYEVVLGIITQLQKVVKEVS